MMRTVRNSFVKYFGEEAADCIVRAAEEHSNGVNCRNKGKDPFKWAITIVIGYQCIEADKYRSYHKVPDNLTWELFKDWVIKHGNLQSHTGDVDYLTLATGGYKEFIDEKKMPKSSLFANENFNRAEE